MVREHFKEYFDVLEIHSDSSHNDVVKAYNYLRNLYSRGSIVTMPLDTELSPDRREAILDQINEAFSAIMEMMNQEDLEKKKVKVEKKQAAPPQEEATDSPDYSGEYFREIRLAKGIKLQDLAFLTKISRNTLSNIERGNYRDLPPDGYLRWHVKTYAKFLDLDADEATNEYMKKYRIWKRHIVNK